MVRVVFEVADGVEGQLAIEMTEPLVFTAGEQVLFGEGSVVALKVEDLVPAEYRLAQNYPNPFNPFTDIRYQISDQSHVTLKVYNTLGQEAVVLVDGVREAGYYEVQWDASEMASGVYFYRLQADEFTATRRMVLMK